MQCEDFRWAARSAQISFAEATPSVPCQCRENDCARRTVWFVLEFDLFESQICVVLYCYAQFFNESRAPHGCHLASAPVSGHRFRRTSYQEKVFRADALRFPIPARSDSRFRTPGIRYQIFFGINKQTKALSPKSWASGEHDRRK